MTIPRAIPIALGLVVVLYTVVLGTALLALGPAQLAAAPAPLVAVVEAGRWSASALPSRRLVCCCRCWPGSAATLLMARRRELPGYLDAVHPHHRTPHRAEVTDAVLVIGIVLVADLHGAIGFSSFAVLTYYALANASAWRLSATERRWPRWLAGLGVVLCIVLAATPPLVAVVGGAVLLATGIVRLAGDAAPPARVTAVAIPCALRAALDLRRRPVPAHVPRSGSPAG